MDACVRHRRFEMLEEASPVDQISEEVLGRQLLELLVDTRHRLNDQPRHHQVQRQKHQPENAQQGPHETVERASRFLQRIKHWQLHHLHADRLVHLPAEAILLAVNLQHRRRGSGRHTVAGQALRLLDDDGSRDIHRALHAFALKAGQLRLRGVCAEFFDQRALPVAGPIARVGRVEHSLLVFIGGEAVTQATQGLCGGECRHCLRQEALVVERVEMRLDLVGGVAADGERRFHQHLRILANIADGVALQRMVVVPGGTDQTEQEDRNQKEIEFDAYRHKAPRWRSSPLMRPGPGNAGTARMI